MGCGSSVAAIPTEGSLFYDHERKGNGCVKSSESLDSGVGYELGSKESTRSEDELLPDLAYLRGPSFANRKPLPPHPFEATFKERFPVIEGSNEVNHDVEAALEPAVPSKGYSVFICEESEISDIAFIESLPRPSTPEFIVSGTPLRPLRRISHKTTSTKHAEIFTAVNKSQNPVNDRPILSNRTLGEKGDHLLFELHKSVDYDTQVAARPPSRGGLAFDLVFGEQEELNTRREKLKQRQKTKAPLLPKKISKSQVQRKLLEAELRRQQQTLETMTKLSESHNTVDEVGSRSSKMEENKRIEMKKVQDAAMTKAMAARRQHLENMRDKIRSKNDKIKKANLSGRESVRPPTSGEIKLPSLLGF